MVFDEILTPNGTGKSVSFKDTVTLCDYFEQCMIAVTFSFQALETFCNHVIANELKGTFNLQRRKEVITVTPIELERLAATEEKLAIVLPQLLARATPKGKKVWDDFVRLKRARDSTIHLKSSDQYPPGGTIDKDSLFYQFLNRNATDFPKWAISMIKYFVLGSKLPRWFLEPMEFLSS